MYEPKIGRKPKRGESLYDLVKDLIGSCDSGGVNSSVNTGRKYAKMLQQDRRAKHAVKRQSLHRAIRSK